MRLGQPPKHAGRYVPRACVQQQRNTCTDIMHTVYRATCAPDRPPAPTVCQMAATDKKTTTTGATHDARLMLEISPLIFCQAGRAWTCFYYFFLFQPPPLRSPPPPLISTRVSSETFRTQALSFASIVQSTPNPDVVAHRTFALRFSWIEL